MRSIITFLILSMFLLPFLSADMGFSQQPLDVYNFGDRLEVSITASTDNDPVYDYLEVYLLCDNQRTQLPREEVALEPNSEFTFDKSVLLINKFAKNSVGDCEVRASVNGLPGSPIISRDFVISNELYIDANLSGTDFEPLDKVTLSGNVEKENEEFVNGFVNISFPESSSLDSENYSGRINNGEFSIEFNLPEDAPAGEHSLNVEAYELDPTGDKSNVGSEEYSLRVLQIPSNLELVLENEEIVPGGTLRVRSILHDQTGQNIISNAIITIKDSQNRILQQTEVASDEVLEYEIPYNQPPGEWSIVGVSRKVTGEINFNIPEYYNVEAEIVNSTLILRNTGNVPYNKQLNINLGGESVSLNPELDVDEVKRYSLSAPDGQYDLEVVADNQVKLTGNVALTGNSVDVSEQSGLGLLSKFPLAWIFVIAILGFMSYMLYRRGFQKTFFGKMKSTFGAKRPFTLGRKSKRDNLATADDKSGNGSHFSKHSESHGKSLGMRHLGKSHNSGVVHEPKQNRAHLSISMSGEKQNSTILCLKIKNYEEYTNSGKTESTSETLDKIIDLAPEVKAYVYTTRDSIFFIWAPIVTKTFKNEHRAINLASEIQGIIKNHNKLFRQKIDLGISINSGEIVARKDNDVLKFMGLGNVINSSKKIASLSDNEIFLSPEIRGRMLSKIKVEKEEKEGTEYFVLKEIKENREDHKKFISEFMRRLEKDNPDEKNRSNSSNNS